jgi:glycosyltransferase involved in cell wall biosynthesis
MKNKIAIIDVTKIYGGAQQTVERIVRLLEDTYNFAVITCSKELYSRLNSLGNNKIKVFYIDKNKILLGFEIRKIIKNENPEIIIFNGQFEAHYSWLFPKRKKIFIRHTSLQQTSSIKRVVYKIEAIFFSDAIIVVNDFIKNQLPKCIHQKIKVIYNWYLNVLEDLSKNRENDKPLTAKENKLKVLYCGRLTKEKNVDIIIEACINFKEFIDLHIVGDGEEREELMRKYYKYENIYFHGFVNYEELHKYYKMADIYINISSYEAFPLSVLDALYYGVPMILSKIPAHLDISRNGEYALLVDINIEDVKNALRKIIDDPLLRYNLSKKSALRVKDFSPEIAKKKLLELFNSLINHEK